MTRRGDGARAGRQSWGGSAPDATRPRCRQRAVGGQLGAGALGAPAGSSTSWPGRFPFTDAADAGSRVSDRWQLYTIQLAERWQACAARGVSVCRGHHDTRRRGRASRRLRKVGLANGSLLSALNKGPTTDRHLASTASVRTPYFAPGSRDPPAEILVGMAVGRYLLARRKPGRARRGSMRGLEIDQQVNKLRNEC
jgi:hypothetical protein